MPIVITSLLLSTTLACFSGLKRSIYEKDEVRSLFTEGSGKKTFPSQQLIAHSPRNRKSGDSYNGRALTVRCEGLAYKQGKGKDRGE